MLCKGERLVILAPLDLVSAHPWQRVTFTTYGRQKAGGSRLACFGFLKNFR